MTHGIQIEVKTAYIAAQSDPDNQRYVFAYTITIRNEGLQGAKLLSRHWVVTDANNKIQEVRGKGVVGQQPRIMPGQAFQYTSAAMIATPVGSMQGSYHMVGDDGEKFDVEIAPFSLAQPRVLH